MVCRIGPVLGIFRCRYGPNELRLSFTLYSSLALHRCLLRLHYPHARICYQGTFKAIPITSKYISFNTLIASKHHFDPHFCGFPARLFTVVSRQLFSHGRCWFAYSYHVWSQAGYFLDVRLRIGQQRHHDRFWFLSLHPV